MPIENYEAVFELQSLISGTDMLSAGLNFFSRLTIYRGRSTKRFRNLLWLQAEHRALLASMGEGWLMVGGDRRIKSVNAVALNFLGAQAQEIVGQKFDEAISCFELVTIIQDVLNASPQSEGEFSVLQGGQERILQAKATYVRGRRSRLGGAVVVLNENTKLRQLERIRREFVANVSHELRTPITSIKGFVETVLDGDLTNQEQAREYLKIVLRQSDRLNAIIDDLLVLSTVEENPGDSPALERHKVPLADIVRSAMQLCSPNALRKNVALVLHEDENSVVNVHPTLFEQAISNLIDNAIKYSVETGAVVIVVGCVDKVAQVRIMDRGCGISSEHLPRLFERFYRVDKARSRKVGGTGLGLAIVKHVALAHGGNITVESKVGSGSTFTISIPATDEELGIDFPIQSS